MIILTIDSFMIHRFFSVLFLGLCISFLAPPKSEAQETQKFGQWHIQCAREDANEVAQCSLVNRTVDANHKDIRLDIHIWPTDNKDKPVLQVRAPLGVLLTSGLGLKIDDKDIGAAGFIRCVPDGCYVEMMMDEQLIESFKSGQQALFIIFKSIDEGIGVPVSLEGFEEGFEALIKKPA